MKNWPISFDMSFCSSKTCPKKETCMRAIGTRFLIEERRYPFILPNEEPCTQYWDNAKYEQKGIGE